MLKRLILLAACLALAACEGSPARETLMGSEGRAERDDAECRSYGAQPGSDAYVQCRIAAKDRTEKIRASARARQPLNCRTTAYGGVANTNCY